MADVFDGPARFSGLARLAVLAAIAFGFAASVSLAAVQLNDKRVALVIGNGAYQNAVRLDNAVFDAKAVADSFRKLGFQVVDGYDLNIDQMRSKVSEFSAALSDSKSALIYYAGHGISVDEENYLVPTDIVLKSPTDLDLNAISVSLLLKQMKRDERVNIVILDACRDNPFAAVLAKQKTRALVVERGLTPIDGDLARGTLIAFASDPKSSALDGPTGAHSPFTEAFLAHLFDAGVPIDTVMSRVRNDVWEKTGHHQLPWVNTSLIGEYELNPQPMSEPAEAGAGEPSVGIRAALKPFGRLPGLSQRLPQRRIRADGEEQNRQHGERQDFRANACATNPRDGGAGRFQGRRSEREPRDRRYGTGAELGRGGREGSSAASERARSLYGTQNWGAGSGDPVRARAMADKEWLRADIVSRFRASRG